MRRTLGLGLALALTISLAGVTAAAGRPSRPIAIPQIGIQTVELTGDFVPAAGTWELSGFVETGSLDGHCLVSLQETTIAGIVRSVYCAPRQIERDGRLMNGIFIHVFLDAEAPPETYVSVNYYQEQMVTNPAAIPCGLSC